MEQGIIIPLENDILLSSIPKAAPMWSAGPSDYSGVSFTHQMVANKVYESISSAYPSIFPNGSEELIRYADFPDHDPYESEYLNNMHFYHGRNKDNYWRGHFGDIQNAKTRFLHHFNMAVVLYGIGDKTEAYRSLGKALHYISDLSTPVHTGDQLEPWMMIGGPLFAAINGAEMIANHVYFEDIANIHVGEFLGNYEVNVNLSVYSLDQIAEAVTSFSYSYYEKVCTLVLSRINGKDVAETTTRYAASACASVMRKFAETVTDSSKIYQFIEIEVVKSYYVFPAFWNWDVKFKNNNPFNVTFKYNSKLCFQNDAMNTTNLTDYKEIQIRSNSTSTVRITFNGTAGFVTGFAVGSIGDLQFKLITCANNLKYSNNVGTCTPQRSIVMI